jgi:fermentation-respiration switch protein FrsA (DUF1100 family)
VGVRLEGIVSIPEDARGFVVFVHGSGSSRHSPRNQYVAQTLQEGGLATLLFDLLTPYEEESDLQTRYLRFDIDLLAKRTTGVLEWLNLQPYAYGLKRGLFGSSTGAAAALIAAAELPDMVDAVVSRGGNDDVVIDLNQQALGQMQPLTETKLTVVPGASHLFEEPGALEHAARLARDWFQTHLDGVTVR